MTEFFQTLTKTEGQILLWIQENIRNPFFTPVVNAITHLGDSGWFWILITLLLILVPGILLHLDKKKYERNQMSARSRRTLTWLMHVGHMSAGALLSSLVINNIILKPLVNRTRPYDAIEGLVTTVVKEVDASFPSGHTGASLASAWVLYKELPKRYGVPALVLAVLIALSRLYVGVHFPTDVLGGTVTGLVSAEIGRFLFALLQKKAREKQEREDV